VNKLSYLNYFVSAGAATHLINLIAVVSRL